MFSPLSIGQRGWHASKAYERGYRRCFIHEWSITCMKLANSYLQRGHIKIGHESSRGLRGLQEWRIFFEKCFGAIHVLLAATETRSKMLPLLQVMNSCSLKNHEKPSRIAKKAKRMTNILNPFVNSNVGIKVFLRPTQSSQDAHEICFHVGNLCILS